MSTIIQDKLNSASAGSTVVLDKGAYDEIVEAPVGKSLTLDLNGSEWTCAAKSTPLTVPPGADLTVINGTISAVDNATVRLGGKDATARSSLRLGAGLKIVNTNYAAVFIAAKGDLVTEADITASGEDPCCIQGNGSAPYFDNTCRIIGGHLSATSTSGESVCIYWPQVGDLVIEGGLLEGDSGVEIRAGTLTITGGRIVALHDTYTVKANGSGTTTNGAAVAIAQHTTKLPVAVKVTGGEFTGQVAFSEANPHNNSLADVAKISATISGGSFVGGTAAVKSADLTDFVFGGDFNQPVDTKYLAVGVRPTQDGDTWTYWYPSDGGEATELSSILVDGKVVTTLQGTLVGAVDELPSVTADGLTKGMVLYSRADKQYHSFDGAKWTVEDMDISDDAIDQDHMDSTRPAQTKAVYAMKKDLEGQIDDAEDRIEDALALKENTITGAATTIAHDNLPMNMVLVSNDAGKVAISKVDAATLEYLAGLNVNIKDELAKKMNISDAETAHNALTKKIDDNKTATDAELKLKATKDELAEKLLDKQDVLTPGDHITIKDGVINADVPDEVIIDPAIAETDHAIANRAVFGLKSEMNSALGNKLDKTTAGATYATKTEVTDAISTIKESLSAALVYKDTVTDYSDLDAITERKRGDVYNILNSFVIGEDSYPSGTNVAWDGTVWDPLGGTIDLSGIQAETKIFQGIVEAWEASTDLEEYGYRGYISCSDVTAEDAAYVTFSIDDASSGNYAPICETGENRVYVYSKVQDTPTVYVVVQKCPVNPQAKTYTVVGAASGWTGSASTGIFGYKGFVSVPDATAKDNATVVFEATDAATGNYAPICETGEGTVWVYAREKPASDPTVTVVVQKG